jgi:hypothetical protein
VNLPTWRLDTTTELFRAKDAPDDPFVVTRQTGPLDAPDVAITGGAFQQQLTPEKIQEETQDAAPGADAADADDAEADGAAVDTPSSDDPGAEQTEQPDDAGDPADGSGTGQPKRAEEIIRGVLDQLQNEQ